MTEQQRDDLVRAYILEHRDTYTREVITRQLVEAGHDPIAVEVAWSHVAGTGAGTGMSPAAPSARARRTARELGHLILLIYGLAALAALWGIFAMGSFTGRPDEDLFARVWLALYAVALIVGGLAIRRFLRGAGWQRVLLGILAGVLVFVGLSGACLAGLGS